MSKKQLTQFSWLAVGGGVTVVLMVIVVFMGSIANQQLKATSSVSGEWVETEICEAPDALIAESGINDLEPSFECGIATDAIIGLQDSFEKPEWFKRAHAAATAPTRLPFGSHLWTSKFIEILSEPYIPGEPMGIMYEMSPASGKPLYPTGSYYKLPKYESIPCKKVPIPQGKFVKVAGKCTKVLKWINKVVPLPVQIGIILAPYVTDEEFIENTPTLLIIPPYMMPSGM